MDSLSQCETKERIMRAAEAVFTEKGFEKATVRDICKRAGVNGAAVNYHFQDKAGLFVSVLNDWWEQSVIKYPPELGVDPNDSPEERLRAYITSHLRRVFYYGDDVGPETRVRRGKLILREFASETPHQELFKNCQEREIAVLVSIVGELLGGEPPEEVSNACCISIRAQAVHCFLIHLHDPEFGFDDEEQLTAMADHITAFSLGGVGAIRSSRNGREG